MNHNIDTKAILHLASMGNEIREYLKEQFPDAFNHMPEKLFYLIDTEADTPHLFICGGLKSPTWRQATTAEIQRFIPDYKPE